MEQSYSYEFTSPAASCSIVLYSSIFIYSNLHLIHWDKKKKIKGDMAKESR